jgi:ribosomal protein S18 acetylase RimI-like enzyme
MPSTRELAIRPATPADAQFLAWTAQEADRAHTGKGSLDLIFDLEESERLDILAALTTSDVDSYLHHSRFLVADLDDQPAAALSGYVAADLPTDSFEAATRHTLRQRGWPAERINSLIARKRYFSSNYFRVPEPSDTLRVEWVAARPQARRRGLIQRLLISLLEAARDRGMPTAHVGTPLGNTPAIRAYERAGFTIYAEARHADFEAIYNTPGIVFLRQTL